MCGCREPHGVKVGLIEMCILNAIIKIKCFKMIMLKNPDGDLAMAIEHVPKKRMDLQTPFLGEMLLK